MTPDERRDVLDRTLQDWVAAGWRIENRSDYQRRLLTVDPSGSVSKIES